MKQWKIIIYDSIIIIDRLHLWKMHINFQAEYATFPQLPHSRWDILCLTFSLKMLRHLSVIQISFLESANIKNEFFSLVAFFYSLDSSYSFIFMHVRSFFESYLSKYFLLLYVQKVISTQARETARIFFLFLLLISQTNFYSSLNIDWAKMMANLIGTVHIFLTD